MDFSLEHIRIFLAAIFYILTTALLIVLVIHVLKYSYGVTKPPASYNRATHIILIFAFVFYLFLYLIQFEREPQHIANLIGIFTALALLQLLRAFLNSLEQKPLTGQSGVGQCNLQKSIGEFFANAVVFMGIYVSIMYSSLRVGALPMFRYIGYTLCVFTIFRVVKYRFFDDLYRRRLYTGRSYSGSPSLPATTLLQGLFNVLLRAYFYVTVSFGCIYAIMAGGLYDDSGLIFIFKQETLSGNILVDFIYFSVITMTGGESENIVPVGVMPKLLSIVQIIAGYFFLGTLIALIVGRFSTPSGEETA
jgi:hypothetical protein